MLDFARRALRLSDSRDVAASRNVMGVAIERLFLKKLDIEFRTAVMLSFRGIPSLGNGRPNELLKHRALMSQPS